jgi:hypothetical protein
VSSGWFLARPGGSPIGPLRAEALLRRIRGGTLSPDELVWKEGMEDWTTIGNVPELALAIVRDEPAQAQGAPPEEEEPYPATIREPEISTEMPLSEEAPETKRGAVSQSLLEKARRPKPRAQAVANVQGPRPSLTRVLEDPRPVTQPVEVRRESLVATVRLDPKVSDAALAPRRLELAVESVPLTRNFGSTGMVIATPVDERDIGRAGDVPIDVYDAPAPGTLRLPNAPVQPVIPVYESAAYDQLAAEQEEPAPNSGPPPPYPANFPAAAAYAETRPAMPSRTLVLPQAAALQAAGRASQPQPAPAAPAAAPAKAAPPRKGGARWVLVLVLFVLIGVALGLLGARYVVHLRAASASPGASAGAP